MSVLIYVQYHRPFKKHKDQRYTTKSHADHMGYIATRPRTYKNPGENHGLMGNLDGEGLCELSHVWRAKKAVTDAANEKRDVYRAVVSMTRETADEKGLLDKDAWRDLAERQARIIAEQNGIKLENFRYACAAHNEGGHPHLHFMFWDAGKHAVSKSYIEHSKIGGDIRKAMIKTEFAEEIREYCEQKNVGEKSIRQVSDEILDAFEHEIVSIKPGKFEKLLRMDGVSDSYLPEVPKLATALYRLTGFLPKRGRIAYGKLTSDVRVAVDSLVWDMIDNSPALKEAVSKYVDAKMGMVGLHGIVISKSEKEAYGLTRDLEERDKKAYMELYQKLHQEKLEEKLHDFTGVAHRMVAAKILKAVKDLNIELNCMERDKEQFERKLEKFAGNVFLAVLRQLDTETRIAEVSPRVVAGGELSAQAKKEKALEARDKGWEM